MPKVYHFNDIVIPDNEQFSSSILNFHIYDEAGVTGLPYSTIQHDQWIYQGSSKYMMFSYDDDGVIKYGWIKLKCQFNHCCWGSSIVYQVALIQDDLNVFPNPTKGILYIPNTQGFTQCFLITTAGISYDFTYQFLSNEYIDITNFTSGTYFLKLISSDGTRVEVVCKQN